MSLGVTFGWSFAALMAGAGAVVLGLVMALGSALLLPKPRRADAAGAIGAWALLAVALNVGSLAAASSEHADFGRWAGNNLVAYALATYSLALVPVVLVVVQGRRTLR